MLRFRSIAVSRFYEKDAEQFPEFFLCFMCKYVMLHAFQLSCGHLVCENCKKSLKKDNQQTCQNDECKQYKQLPHKIFEDKYVTRKIQTHQVVCKYAQLGCSWNGQLQEYQSHIDNCSIGLECSGYQNAQHSELFMDPKEIKLKTAILPSGNDATVCSYCNIECSSNDDLATHQKYDCPDFEAPCPFTEVGCPEHKKMTQKYLLDHKNFGSLIHVDLLLEDHCSLRRTFNNEISKFYNNTKDWKELENNFRVIQTDFVSMSQKMGIQLNDIDNRLVALEERTRNDGGDKKAVRALEMKLNDIEAVLGCLQDDRTTNVRNGSVEQRITHMELMLENFASTAQRLERVNLQQEKELAFKTARVESLEAQMNEFELTSHDGTLIWKIPNFTQKRRDSITKRHSYILSPFFYSGTRGYKMCLRLYPNGDGLGKTTHISIFFTILRGSYDAILPWPFKQRVHLSILDQNNTKHCEDSFRPDPNSPSFKRPKSESNISSGCPLFMPLSELDNNAYVKDDCIFVKVSVEGFTV